MAQPVIRLGDPSSHGGVVISASRVPSNGRSIARVGDMHSCPVPGHGITAIATGSPRFSIDGQAVARQGDVAGCGASLIATDQLTTSA